MGSFVFKWPYPANEVYVTGDFDDWAKTVKLDKVGDHFEKEVHLSHSDTHIYYKFVVDNEWVLDQNAPKGEDGHNNTNNVLRPEDIKKDAAADATQEEPSRPLAHRVVATSNSPPGSFSATGGMTEAPTVSAGGEGAPLITKEQSDANAARWIPHITPEENRDNIRPLPQSDGATAAAAAAAPSAPAVAAADDSDLPGAFPETPADELKAAPLPAEGHANTESSVTTSKEAYENAGGEGTAGNETVSVNPLPADGHQNTQSSVTTSKEDYEKAGALGTAGAVLAGAGAAVAGVFSKPKEDDKEKGIIPESSLPMNAEKVDATDAGPVINSAGPNTTTAELASQVPLEPKRDAQVVEPGIADSDAAAFIRSSGPDTTTAALASEVPTELFKNSIPGGTGAGHATEVPAALFSNSVAPEVAAEKSQLEQELLQKVPESQATGEPASAAAAQSSYHGLATSVPQTVEESMAKANAPPEAAADASVVAEKSALERELASKVPVEESAGEPAPTTSAATATSAPQATTGAVAGAAAAGGVAAVGTAAAVHHEATKTPAPGVSPTAGAALSDGTEDPTVSGEVSSPTNTGPVEKSEATATEYAPPRAVGVAPGVSPNASAALSDGTEDPTAGDVNAKPERKQSIVEKIKDAVTPNKSESSPATPKKTDTEQSTASTPATSTNESPATTDKKKKRHRLSAMFKKIFD